MTEIRRQMSEAYQNNASSIKRVKDLKVYQESYKLAMEIFKIIKYFPKNEVYSLTDQIRRASRSVPMNIREGYAKRRYPQVFVRHLIDALGSAEEVRGWLDFSCDMGYISKEIYQQFDNRYDQLCAMLHTLSENWQKYDIEKGIKSVV